MTHTTTIKPLDRDVLWNWASCGMNVLYIAADKELGFFDIGLTHHYFNSEGAFAQSTIIDERNMVVRGLEGLHCLRTTTTKT